jgi:hypothetical protein
MEALTGRPLRTKIYWVRRRLLGIAHGFCNGGVVSGSTFSPAGANTLDLHELAHAVLRQHEFPDADPPTLLGEGWAVSREWADDRLTLARMALRARNGTQVHQSLHEWMGCQTCLKELTSPKWYHHDSGPVYSVGGAFVDFLIRRYGAERFLELYFTCRPGSFETVCRRALGTDLDALERLFWEDVERSTDKSRPGP